MRTSVRTSTKYERYLEWMARAHYTFAKGETQVIDLAQFTKGYDGGTYTVSAPTGVTATVSGTKMTVKLADNFGGVGYIKFTLKDKEGDTFTRNIGVTQMLAAATPEPTSNSSSSAVPTSSETIASSSSAEMNPVTQNSSSSVGSIAIALVTRAVQPFSFSITDNVVMLTGISDEARITVMDVSGHSVMMQKNVVQTRGMASVNMQPYGCGIYLVNIRGKLSDGKKMNKTVRVMRR